MEQDLTMRIFLVVAGLLILAFGIANEFSNGWQLDIVNLITIFGGIVVIILGILGFLPGGGSLSRSRSRSHQRSLIRQKLIRGRSVV